MEGIHFQEGSNGEYAMEHEEILTDIARHLAENDRRHANYLDVGGPQGKAAEEYHHSTLGERVRQMQAIVRQRPQIIPSRGAPMTSHEFALIPRSRAAYRNREEAIKAAAAQARDDPRA